MLFSVLREHFNSDDYGSAATYGELCQKIVTLLNQRDQRDPRDPGDINKNIQSPSRKSISKMKVMAK